MRTTEQQMQLLEQKVTQLQQQNRILQHRHDQLASTCMFLEVSLQDLNKDHHDQQQILNASRNECRMLQQAYDILLESYRHLYNVDPDLKYRQKDIPPDSNTSGPPLGADET